MQLEKIETCPLCQGKILKEFLTCRDYTVSGELFHVEQCQNCKFTFTNPRPTQETAGTFYLSSQYISHAIKSNGLMDRIYLIIRTFTMRWKFGLIKSSLKGKSLLDFGCGTGTFASYCKSKGVEVYGIEPSLEARTKAIENFEAFEKLGHLPEKKYSVITLWHVLEHVYDLNETLQKLKNLLEETGTIFIAVPNYESYDARQYLENWAAYDLPRHVWHFSEQTMKRVLVKNGLRLVNKIPMKLDSFYVSLLSEKNIAGGKLSIFNSFKALMNGFASNWKAKQSINYSSIIYQVQK